MNLLNFAEHSIDNRDVFVVAEQGLHRAKAFSAFHPDTLVRSLGVLGYMLL